MLYAFYIDNFNSFLSKCNMGRWQCTEDKCSEMCELVGINHVRTLDNYEYSFNPASLCEFKVVSVCIITD